MVAVLVELDVGLGPLEGAQAKNRSSLTAKAVPVAASEEICHTVRCAERGSYTQPAEAVDAKSKRQSIAIADFMD